MTGFALLTLPAATNPLRDFDMRPRVEVVLATGRTVQQVTAVQTANIFLSLSHKGYPTITAKGEVVATKYGTVPTFT